MDICSSAKFTFQWHITDQCNYRCRHCYQKAFQHEGLPFDKLTNVLDKLEDFISYYRSTYQTNIKAHINFTGGEPFLRNDFLSLLEETRNRNIFSFSILSNGKLLGHEDLKILKSLSPGFVQLSLEGNREINDDIRGRGGYENVIKALRTYKKYKIPVIIAFTANKINYKHFGEVVKTGRKYGAVKVWADRYLPVKEDDSLSLSKEESKEFFNLLNKCKANTKFHLFKRTEVSTSRALQFLTCGDRPYRCSAGRSLLTIMPNGDLLPCRRMPILVGNLFKDDLIALYEHSHLLKKLRSDNSVEEACQKCYYYKTCNAGLKCLSNIVYGDPFRKDPHCWL